MKGKNRAASGPKVAFFPSLRTDSYSKVFLDICFDGGKKDDF